MIYKSTWFCIAFLLLGNVFAVAQKLPSIEEHTKGLTRTDGFVPMYFDEVANKVLLEINQWQTEILYQLSLPGGLGSNDIGLDRGKLGATHIVYFERAGNKVLMVEPNYDYRALSNDKEEVKAVAQSFGKSVLWGFTAIAAKGNAVLVDATDFLLSDGFGIGFTLKMTSQGNFSIDKSRSAIDKSSTKNFPENTELSANLTYVNSDGNVGRYVRSVSPSPNAITLQVRHSFIQLPDNNYTPRVLDPRSSFQSTSFYDYASPVGEPLEKHFINRHRLEKKDKNAAISEAVEPIVYYLDRGTPEPIRTALLEGASWWNQAFEAAGFRNAFQVKMLPEGADPMDVRYNMINWVHRSTRGWSMGYSVSDPRTGEIIKGNVILGSLRVRQDYLIFTGLLSPYRNGKPANDIMMQAALARLRQLSAHEVGHTIGLVHNYAASVSNRASVMDYPHPLIEIDAGGSLALDKAYAEGIGEWDKVAVKWGYEEFADETKNRLGDVAVLQNAFKNGLQFISDRDARAAGGLHAKAHLWDNGSDAVEELGQVMKIRSLALKTFDENVLLKGQPMAMLEDALVPVYFYHRYQIEAATKLIGGADYSYALKGDGTTVFKPLGKAKQQQALDAIIACMQPSFLAMPENIAALIPPRPANYSFSNELFRKRTGLAFDKLSPAETAADLPLSFLFHPDRLNRLVQQQDETGFGYSTMLATLVDKLIKVPPTVQDIKATIQMQTSQVLLTYLLSASVNDENSYAVKAESVHQLQLLKSWLENQAKATGTQQWKAHCLLALERMKHPEKAKPTLHKEAPPGAPIGCGWPELPAAE